MSLIVIRRSGTEDSNVDFGLGSSGANQFYLCLTRAGKAPRLWRCFGWKRGDYFQTSPNISHPITMDIDAINKSSTTYPILMLRQTKTCLPILSISRSVEYGRSYRGAKHDQEYTDSFSASNESTNPWPLLSSVLSDLKAIGMQPHRRCGGC